MQSWFNQKQSAPGSFKPAYHLKLKFLETTVLLGLFLQNRQQNCLILLKEMGKKSLLAGDGQCGLDEEAGFWNQHFCLDGWFAVSFPPLCGRRSVCPSLFTLHLQAGVNEKHNYLKIHKCAGWMWSWRFISTPADNNEEKSRCSFRPQRNLLHPNLDFTGQCRFCVEMCRERLGGTDHRMTNAKLTNWLISFPLKPYIFFSIML